MEPQLKDSDFKFNPPNAPYCSGACEREVRSIKAGLQVSVGSQAVSEDVLNTTLVEIEGSLNSKPLGYLSADSPILIPSHLTPSSWGGEMVPLSGSCEPVLAPVAYSSDTAKVAEDIR